jgi:hypothetical protein
MTKLLRKYTQTTETYAVQLPPLEGEYVANIVTHNPSGKVVSYSISLEGVEVENQDERDAVMTEIERFNKNLE